MVNPDNSSPDIHHNQAKIQIGGLDFGQHNVIQIEGDVIGTLYGYTPKQLGEIIAALHRAEQPLTYTGRPPYLGLATYQESDVDIFFGRELLVAELLERLKSTRFLCLSGPSGCGKSSLVRAGIIPHLRAGQVLPGSDKWLISIMVPGNNPLESLSKAISAMAFNAGKDFRATGDYLLQNGIKDPTALETVIDLLTQEEDTKRAVLLIDQFEQVFTAQVEIQVAFLAQIIYATQVENGRLTTILTLRSDFLGHCAAYPSSQKLINSGFQLIGAMQVEELARAMSSPALKAGVDIDPELVQQVIADMRGEPGALPLMQFALRDLFDSQNPSMGKYVHLTRQGYLARGGVWQALRRHADAILAKLNPQEHDIAKKIFTRLVNISPDQVITRRKAPYAELEIASEDTNSLNRVLERLADARLVIAEGEHEQSDEMHDQRFYTIAHERLTETWPWLNRLIEENRQMIALTNQIETDALLWEEHHKDPSYLYRGGKLSATELQEDHITLSSEARYFLQNSHDHQSIELRSNFFNQLRNMSLRGMLGGALGFSLAYLFNVWNQIQGENLWFLTLIFISIFWGLIGGLSGLIIAIGIMLAQFKADQRLLPIRYLISGASGALGFALAFIAFALLSNKANDLPVLILEGGAWGFITGMGITWAVQSPRPLWIKAGALGAGGGFFFILFESFGKAYLRPHPPALPALWQIFLAGALVPVCLLLALSLARSPDQDNIERLILKGFL